MGNIISSLNYYARPNLNNLLHRESSIKRLPESVPPEIWMKIFNFYAEMPNVKVHHLSALRFVCKYFKEIYDTVGASEDEILYDACGKNTVFSHALKKGMEDKRREIYYRYEIMSQVKYSIEDICNNQNLSFLECKKKIKEVMTQTIFVEVSAEITETPKLFPFQISELFSFQTFKILNLLSLFFKLIVLTLDRLWFKYDKGKVVLSILFEKKDIKCLALHVKVNDKEGAKFFVNGFLKFLKQNKNIKNIYCLNLDFQEINIDDICKLFFALKDKNFIEIKLTHNQTLSEEFYSSLNKLNDLFKSRVDFINRKSKDNKA